MRVSRGERILNTFFFLTSKYFHFGFLRLSQGGELSAVRDISIVLPSCLQGSVLSAAAARGWRRGGF